VTITATLLTEANADAVRNYFITVAAAGPSGVSAVFEIAVTSLSAAPVSDVLPFALPNTPPPPPKRREELFYFWMLLLAIPLLLLLWYFNILI